MPSVNGAKSKWANNTDWDRVTAGYDRFQEESGEDTLQDAWEATITSTGNDGYTSGVEEFLGSEGGVDNPSVDEDYDWESTTLDGGSNWANDAQSDESESKFNSRTGEDMADTWFSNYASSFGEDA